MPNVSISLILESNKFLLAPRKKIVPARSSKISADIINAMMKKASNQLSR
jgi:hypothetical protein